MHPTTPARTLKLERLLEISRMLNQAIELEPFLQTIANCACELTLSEGGSIFLFEEETGLLKFVASPRLQAEMLKRVACPDRAQRRRPRLYPERAGHRSGCRFRSARFQRC